MGSETVEQVAQTHFGGYHARGVQAQAGWDSEKPGLVSLPIAEGLEPDDLKVPSNGNHFLIL